MRQRVADRHRDMAENFEAVADSYVEAAKARGIRSWTTIRSVLDRVLIPRFIAAYTYHLNGTSRITDAPTIRSLNFALQDDFEDWRRGWGARVRGMAGEGGLTG